MNDGMKLARWMAVNNATREEVCAWLGFSIATFTKVLNDDPKMDAYYYDLIRKLVSGGRPRLERVLAG